MAGDGERNHSLKGALFESLSAILSPMHDVRAAGEEQIKALEVTEEFGVHLAELTVDTNMAFAVRQLSSVLLRQYVEAHWSQHSEKYRAPETSPQAKAIIRQILPVGLKETISKVRTSVAYAVSAIAAWDWPEQWPELFGILMQALISGNPDAVHGAMRVLTEFCREVTDNQMPQVAPVILPEMFKIFSQAEVYSIRTRSRAVNIFNTCAGLIAAMNELHKGTAKQLLFPVLAQFTEAFVQAIQQPDGLTMDSGLKVEVLKALTVLVKSFPKTMSQWIGQILPPVWQVLTHSSDVYVRTVVNNTDEADDPVDSDGEVLGFENLVYSVFEFIHALIDTSKFRTVVKKSVNDLLYYVMLYMQITEDQERSWSASPDQFVEDEDEDSFSYSVRISAQDLLLSLSSEFQKEAAPGIAAAVTRHLQEAEQAKNANSVHWWKVHESVMLSVGSVQSMICKSSANNNANFDLNGFLTSVVLSDLNLSVSPFLIGRCLWTASRFTENMSIELIQQFLTATVTGLQEGQAPSVRISAVRAVYGFCDHLKLTENTHILQPFLQSITDGLLSIATQFSAEVLALVLETVVIVCSIDKEFTASNEAKITPLGIAIFLKYSSDPLVVSLTLDLFRELAENEAIVSQVETRLVPTLVSVLQAQDDKVPTGIQSVALDMIETLVRAHPLPLSDGLIVQVFPAAVQCILQSDDNATLQSGGEALRAYVSCALDQLGAFQDGQGQNGVAYVIQVVLKLLNPTTSESTASFVGRLVSILISKLGPSLGDSLDLMLRAVLSKMQQAETLSVIQNLVLVFAHLLHSQMEAVLDFLSGVPGPTGKPALEFVLTEWCSKQHLFYGAYEGKISTVALSKLLLHAVQSNDPRLQNIEVKGDLIHSNSDVIRTRSRAVKTPDEWTNVPVLIKIYKLLINELSNQIEASSSKLVDGEDDDEDGEWEDVVEEGDDDDDADFDVGRDDTLAGLLSQLAPSHMRGFECDEEEEDDPDAAKDPISAIDLQAYLTDFLTSLSQQPCFPTFSQHHSESEKLILRTAGIQV